MRISMLLMALLLSKICCAQVVKEALVEAYPIEVGWDKTTVLVFPYEVASADFGTPALLSEKDRAAPNVLKLKAAQKHFQPTSMYVITAEGKLYPFSVTYTDFPDGRPVDIGMQKEVESAKALLSGSAGNPGEIASGLDRLWTETPKGFSWGKKQGKIRIGLGKVVEANGVIFFQLAIKNSSGLDYLPKSWEFTVRDKKQAKRTAVRNVSKEPVAFRIVEGVAGNSGKLVVFAFPTFTISDAKEFSIQVFEKNGDRNPVLSVSGKALLRAEPIFISNQK